MAATPFRPAAAAPARPPHPLPPPPPPPLPHHDTTLTLALALPLPPPPLVLARVGRSSPPTDDTPPCSECGKRFASPKALFGHMRCHPERQWRGMTPRPQHLRHRAVVAAAAADLQCTAQEREIATSLLMLAGARPTGAAKGKKSNLGASPRAKVSCGASASASSPPPTTAPASAPAPPPRCDADHKCSVCARGFATGQALGGHKRCHWEKTACEEGAAAAVAPFSGGCTASTTSSSQAAPATMLDLNLPPPGMPPLPQKTDQGGSLDATLDLKLGF